MGCSVFSAFFFVRPVALRDEDLIVRGYGRMHTRIREVRLLALADGHGARFVGALLVGLAARLSGRQTKHPSTYILVV